MSSDLEEVLSHDESNELSTEQSQLHETPKNCQETLRFVCLGCGRMMMVPVVLELCGHTLCADCAELLESRPCPKCGAEVEWTVPNLSLKQSLELLLAEHAKLAAEELKIEYVIKTGDYSSLSQASYRGEPVAVKTFFPESGDIAVMRAKAWLGILAFMEDSPIVPKLLAWGEDALGQINVVMELLPGGNWQERLAEPTSFWRLFSFLTMLAEGLAELHAKGFRHGRLTLEHILQREDSPVLIGFNTDPPTPDAVVFVPPHSFLGSDVKDLAEIGLQVLEQGRSSATQHTYFEAQKVLESCRHEDPLQWPSARTMALKLKKLEAWRPKLPDTTAEKGSCLGCRQFVGTPWCQGYCSQCALLRDLLPPELQGLYQKIPSKALLRKWEEFATCSVQELVMPGPIFNHIRRTMKPAELDPVGLNRLLADTGHPLLSANQAVILRDLVQHVSTELCHVLGCHVVDFWNLQEDTEVTCYHGADFPLCEDAEAILEKKDVSAILCLAVKRKLMRNADYHSNSDILHDSCFDFLVERAIGCGANEVLREVLASYKASKAARAKAESSTGGCTIC